MILISTSEDDFSTVSVMCWLKYFEKKFIISNPYNNIQIEEIRISNNDVKINLVLENSKEKTFNLKTLESYWYRRGSIIPTYSDTFNKMKVRNSLRKEINDSVNEEKEVLRRFIDNTLSKKLKNINKFEDNSLSKLEALSLARDLEILIPDTYILTKKKDLEKLLMTTRLIIKNCNPGAVSLETNFEGIVSEFNIEDLINTPETFAPTMFQKLIEKKYEIRTFYLDEKFYSSVIFSQSDNQTKIDFRNYNFEKPNRVSPFELPSEISKKLILLSNELKLNSGSFDLIVTKENEFIFLEVNPVGQFYQVSFPCNYNLEKIISQTL